MGSFDYSNTAPDVVNLPYAVSVRAQALSDATLSSPFDLLDGVSFVGAYYRGNNNSLVFLGLQSTASQIGVYMLDHDSGAEVSVSGSFSSGTFSQSGLSNSAMYAVKALSSTVLTAGDGSTSNTFAADANGERWLIVKSSAGGAISFTGPTSGTASSLLKIYPAKYSRNTTGLTYEVAGNGVYVSLGTTKKGTWYTLTSYDPGTGVRTYATGNPGGSPLQFTNVPPGSITP